MTAVILALLGLAAGVYLGYLRWTGPLRRLEGSLARRSRVLYELA